jgi:hypothetical protein
LGNERGITTLVKTGKSLRKANQTIHAPESEDQAINRNTIFVWATDSSGEDSIFLLLSPYLKLLTSFQVTVSSMNRKTQQRSTKFSQTIAVLCLAAILAPMVILIAVDIPEWLRNDWQPWAMGLYAAGIFRVLSLSTKL